MTDHRISITMSQLEALLYEQKVLVVEQLLSQTSVYNPESTESHYKTLNIDKDKFKEVGCGAKYSHEYLILKKYLI